MYRLYNLSQEEEEEVHRPSQKEQSIMDYYYDFMRVSEDFTVSMPISGNVEEMKAQREKLLMFSCLSGLEKYDVVRAQLLSSKNLGTLFNALDRVPATRGNGESSNVKLSERSAETKGSSFRGGRDGGRGGF